MSWDPAEFGDTWSEVYDEAFAHLEDDADQATAFLRHRLAGMPGRVLELGVGTGRIALRLAAAGLDVTGLDSSQRMLDALAAKGGRAVGESAPAIGSPGGGRVVGVLGDMVDPPVDAPFAMVLIAFNTLFALPDQDTQVRCLSACQRLLEPSGELVVEAAVPQPWRFSGQAYAGDVREDQVALEVADHDPVTQTVRSARVLVSDSVGVRNLPLKMRYAWPSEIDLMARLAGLGRIERWAGWQREPFDAEATRHISVYANPNPPSADATDGDTTEEDPNDEA